MKNKKLTPGNMLHYLISDESGIGTIEVVLILIVLIALVAIFKRYIVGLLNTIVEQIDSAASDVWA
ncbi:Flp1 family type IVb pilin [Oribacterium sp. HCP28S3_H8]|jgi:Flp pilus assembly pilin Flp|uniref:Flp1 family type IVb pilin n=1 Tax=Oribacterium sp. HCP28S3_H8 TaxID=3438945 RepID=UPI003F8B2D83